MVDAVDAVAHVVTNPIETAELFADCAQEALTCIPELVRTTIDDCIDNPSRCIGETIGSTAITAGIGTAAGTAARQLDNLPTRNRPGNPGNGTTGSVAAPSGLGGLGDDFTRALDDIDNAVPRPNVRNPKPFANDGRGGTTRLPELDTASNPINYTEHTVNPRPPGGSLDGNRIVTGSDGSVWATTDHFETWTRVR